MGMLDKLVLLVDRVVSPARGTLMVLALVLISYLVMISLPSLTFYRAVSSLIPHETAWLTDREPYLFSRMSRMLEADHDSYRIAWIGGSTMRDALWSEDTLASQIETLTGQTVNVVDLASSGQPIGLSLALAERASCAGRAQMVVLGLNPRRLLTRALVDARPLIGYRSITTEPIAASWRTEFGSDIKAAISLRGRVIGEIWESFRRELSGKKPRIRHPYRKRRPDPTLVEKAAAMQTQHDPEKLDHFLDKFEDVVSRCGAHIVYMLTPINPLLLEEPRFRSFREAQDRLTQDIDQRTQGRHLNVNKSALLKPDDFQDWGHLRSESAMREVTGAAATHIAQQMKKATR